MPQINPALNVLRGPRQVVRVMYQRVQVWPPWRTFCDYFERPNGPLGPFWRPGVIRRTGGYDVCTTIEPYIVSGHVEGDEDIRTTVTLPPTGAMDTVFYDAFDRPAGPLGANWIPATAPMDGLVREMPVIEFARATAPSGAPVRYAFVAAEIEGDYTVTLNINSVAGLNNDVAVLAGFDPVLASGLEFGFHSDGDVSGTGSFYIIEWLNGVIDSTSGTPGSVAIQRYLRIEKRGTVFRLLHAPDSGAFVFLVAFDRPGFDGRHVGMRIEYRAEALYKPYVEWLKVEVESAPPVVDGPHLLNDVMTAETYIGDQFIEIVTDNVHQGADGSAVEGTFILYCQANTKNLCCTAVWCEYRITAGGGELWAYVFQQNALGQVSISPPAVGDLARAILPGFAHPGDPVAKLRWEVGRDGHCRLLVTDDQFTEQLVLDRRVPKLSGDRVGFAFMWRGGGRCDTFADAFDGATLGPDWVLPPGPVVDRGGSTSTPQHLTLSTGAAIGPMTTGATIGADFRSESFTGDHYVETTFSLPATEPCSSCLHEISYYMLFDPDTWTGIAVWIIQNSDGFRLRFHIWENGGVRLDDSYDYFHEWSGAHTITMRFETTRAGLVRALIGSTPVPLGEFTPPRYDYQFDVAGITFGDRIGVATRLDYFEETGPVPRVEAISGGCATGTGCTYWADDFERADGPVGGTWVTGPVQSWATEIGSFVIEDGAAVGTLEDNLGGATYRTNMMHWSEPQGANQAIEIELDNLGSVAYVALATMISATDHSCNYTDFQFYGTNVSAMTYRFWPDPYPGNWTGPFAGVIYEPFPYTLPVTLRMESDADLTTRVYVNGTLLYTCHDDQVGVDVDDGGPAGPADGPYVGFTLEWGFHEDGLDTSPRALRASGGGGDCATSYHILEVCGGLTGIPERETLPVDVVFCVDTTGSMPEGSQIRAILATAVDKLEARYGRMGLRVGVIDYKDWPEQGGFDDTTAPFKIYTDLTATASTYDAAINRFDDESTYGGGNTPETAFSALYAAVGLAWRTGVNRIVVVLADAEPLDPEPHTGYTRESTVELLLAHEVVVTALIDDYGVAYPQSRLAWTAITAATGGDVTEAAINDHDAVEELAQAIVDLIAAVV